MDSDDRAAVRADVVAHAEDVLAGVTDRWGDVVRLDPLPVTPLRDRDASFPADADEFLDEFYPYAAGAAVVEDGRLLCVYSDARDEWETPGGAGEPGETPAETARRETREETGVECELTGVVLARRMEVDLGYPETLPVPVVVFAGRPTGGEVLDGDALADHDEVSDVAWFGPDELPSDLRAYDRKREFLASLADEPRDG